MKARQTSMFQTEDMPLFSGEPIRAKAPGFEAKPVATQSSLAACRFCMDTGDMGHGHFCWCPAGTQARIEACR